MILIEQSAEKETHEICWGLVCELQSNHGQSWKGQKSVPSHLTRQLKRDRGRRVKRRERVFQVPRTITCEDSGSKKMKQLSWGCTHAMLSVAKEKSDFLHHFYSRLLHHRQNLIDLIMPQGFKF